MMGILDTSIEGTYAPRLAEGVSGLPSQAHVVRKPRASGRLSWWFTWVPCPCGHTRPDSSASRPCECGDGRYRPLSHAIDSQRISSVAVLEAETLPPPGAAREYT